MLQLIHHKKLEKAEAGYTYMELMSSSIRKKKKNDYIQQSVHRFPNFPIFIHFLSI